MNTDTIGIIPDDIWLYQFMEYYVRKNELGENICDGTFARQSFKPIPVKFQVEGEVNVFEMIGWGGWNSCPNNRVLFEKTREWQDKYDVKLVKLSHDTLYYRCNRVLDESEVNELVGDVVSFCPECVAAYKPESRNGVKKWIKKNHGFILWWD